MTPTASQLRTADAIEALLAEFPPFLSERDRRIRSVCKVAAQALREGRPLSEVAPYASQAVYGFCVLPDRGSES
jgi:hypothetical protein